MPIAFPASISLQLHALGRTLILCGAREQPAKLMRQADFEDVVGRENICARVEEALGRAQDVFEKIKPIAARPPEKPRHARFECRTARPLSEPRVAQQWSATGLATGFEFDSRLLE